MKRQQMIALAFVAGMVLLACGMIAYNPDKSGAFWVVLVTTELSLGLAGAAMTLFFGRPSDEYPVEVSLLTSSLIYLGLCTLCNLFFAGVVHLRASYLIVAHVLLLGFYVVASLLLRLILHSYVKQEHEMDDAARDAQDLMAQLEHLKLLCSPLPAALQARTLDLLCRVEGQLHWWPLYWHGSLRQYDMEIGRQLGRLSRQLENDEARDDAEITQALDAIEPLLPQSRAAAKALRFHSKKKAG